MGSSQARLATAVQHSKHLAPSSLAPRRRPKPKISKPASLLLYIASITNTTYGSPIVSYGEGCFRAARRGDQAHGWAPDLDKLILSIMRGWESAAVTSLHIARVLYMSFQIVYPLRKSHYSSLVIATPMLLHCRKKSLEAYKTLRFQNADMPSSSR